MGSHPSSEYLPPSSLPPSSLPPSGGERVIRSARRGDLAALLAIEIRCFESDRISRRSFQRMLAHGRCSFLVAQVGRSVLGYALVLFHQGTSLARLYSLAVLPEARGLHLGEQLLDAAEATATEQECVAMRLEVRRDNATAISLYVKRGYRQFSVVPDYYEDHMEAIRYQKRIAAQGEGTYLPVPFYAQTTEFTCGPASLLMAMKAFDDAIEMSEVHELRLWREATTIFMLSGHGGCGPFGLALAAWRRGFRVETWVSTDGPLFRDTVRDPDKKRVIDVVHQDFCHQMQDTDIAVTVGCPDETVLIDAITRGGVPLVLISQWRMSGQKAPHWLVLTGFDSRFVYANDPDVDDFFNKTETDCSHIPIARAEFARMSRFGRAKTRAVVILFSRMEAAQAD